jgi:cardiolipin synthase A/B
MKELLPDATVLAIACAVLVLLCAALVVVIWSMKRQRDPHLKIECDAPIADLVPSMAGLTHGMEVAGNKATILENGAYFDAMLEELSRATRSVHFETFLWKDGKLGTRVADALCERARAGVPVRVILDANGCKGIGKGVRERLEAAGCKVALFHPWHPRNVGVMNQRDHRKLVLLDGRVAFLGGHCIVDEWLGCGDARCNYRDLSIRLEGPAVHQVQSAFSENWVEVTGEIFAGEDYFPKLEPAGDLRVHVARVRPMGSASAVKILHHVAICTARKRLWIQNPYFLPDPEAIEALGKAVREGVDVRIMVPSAEASDMPMVQHAAHRNFARMLELGVRILEYPVTLMHQKTLVVDGCWSAVGSTNFDDRAFEINEEITVGIHSEAFAKQLEAIFERDAKACLELDAKTWAKRGWTHAAKDHFFYLWNEML